ncbi:hypothetical protein I4U23_003715 [Adineta vaga]|nr:hypothetical protein I4U23_003715 [Adineta vaga]
MSTVSLLFTSMQISLCALIILLTLIYCTTITCIRPIICCALYWMIYYAMLEFNPSRLFALNTCSFLIYAQMMCTFQVPLAFIIVSIHRLCLILYPLKLFLKQKRWVIICVLCQWIAGAILSSPIFINQSFCVTAEWKRIYTLIMYHCHLCSCFISRIQPQMTTTQTTTNHSTNQQQPRISRRDIYLLRHMIFMFCIFVGGWAPVYVMTIVMFYINIDLIVMRILSILAELSLLCDIVDLFVYNHEDIENGYPFCKYECEPR